MAVVLTDARAQNVMAYQISPGVSEKLISNPKRAEIEQKLSEYTPQTQKRWVANPLLEALLQGYMNSIVQNACTQPASYSHANPTVQENEAGKKKVAEEDTKGAPSAADDEDEDGPSLFNLFD